MRHMVIKDAKSKELAPGVVLREAHLDNVMVTFVELAEGSVVPEHSHPHEQISVVVAGRLLFKVEGEEREVGPGEVVLLPSNTPHGVATIEGPALAYDCWSPVREDYIME